MKYIKKLFILIVIIVLICALLNLLHNNHNIKYKLNNKYSVNEIFKKENKKNNYYFKITKDKKTYNFTYENKSKSKKIISTIKEYKSKNLTCIMPIYKNNKVIDIYCLLNNKQISSSYLMKSNNKEFKNILKRINNKYKLNTLSYSDKTTTKDYISVYKDNIKDYKYIVWFYKGIYIIDSDGVKKEKLLKKDKYNNDLSYLVDKYYIMINTDLDKNSIEYKEIFIYDLNKYKQKIIKLKEPLSVNTYINGIYKDSLYITDNDTKKQYKIIPSKRKTIKIGDQNKGFKSVDNDKLITIRKNKENFFSNYVSNKKVSELYGNVNIKKYNSNYYFKTKEGKVYQIINGNYKHPILLFESPGIEDLKIKDGGISFIVDNTIYTYTDKYGLRPVIINNEMKYNNKNIYDYMKK